MVFYGNKGFHDRIGYIIWKCPLCSVDGVFSVEQVKKKFTLQFIPIFTYSQKQYLICSTCKATFEVSEDQKELIATNIMTQEQFSSWVNRANEGAEVVERPKSISKEGQPNKEFCPSCGTKLTRQVKFCPNCGNKLSQGWESTKLSRDESVTSTKSSFKNDGKCPYCNSNNVKRKLVEGPLSKEQASFARYWYKYDCRCKVCTKEWFGLDYYESTNS